MSDTLTDPRAEAIVTALYLEGSIHFLIAKGFGIGPAHFSDPFLADVWRATDRLYLADVLPKNPRLAVVEELKGRGELEAIGRIGEASADAMEYLAQVDDAGAGRPMMLRLVELARLRDLRHFASEIVVDMESIRSPGLAPNVWPHVSSLHSRMTGVLLAHEMGDLNAGDQWSSVVDLLDRKAVDTISTGIPSLDAMLAGGWHKGRVNVLGAYTSHGKTNKIIYFLDRIIETTSEGVVLLFTPELTRRKVATRRLCRLARIPNDQIRRTEKTSASVEQFRDQLGRMIVDDTPAPTGEYMMRRARAVAEEFGLLAIGFDYAERFGGDGDVQQRITEGLIHSERVAKRFDVPALVNSQLNREGLINKKPQIDNLAASSSVVKFSSVVLVSRWHAKAAEQLQKPYEGNPLLYSSYLLKNTEGDIGVLDWFILPATHDFTLIDPTVNSRAPF